MTICVNGVAPAITYRLKKPKKGVTECDSAPEWWNCYSTGAQQRFKRVNFARLCKKRGPKI